MLRIPASDAIHLAQLGVCSSRCQVGVVCEFTTPGDWKVPPWFPWKLNKNDVFLRHELFADYSKVEGTLTSLQIRLMVHITLIGASCFGIPMLTFLVVGRTAITSRCQVGVVCEFTTPGDWKVPPWFPWKLNKNDVILRREVFADYFKFEGTLTHVRLVLRLLVLAFSF